MKYISQINRGFHILAALFAFRHGFLSVLFRLKGALYRIWCGVNRLGDSGVKVV